MKNTGLMAHWRRQSTGLGGRSSELFPCRFPAVGPGEVPLSPSSQHCHRQAEWYSGQLRACFFLPRGTQGRMLVGGSAWTDAPPKRPLPRTASLLRELFHIHS